MGRPFAAERLREANGRQSFPDRVLPVEQIGVSQALMAHGCLQERDGCLMADTVAKGHANSGVRSDAIEPSTLDRKSVV